jgi:peptidoglycan/LPS O-acetylase OafA/YrhL
MLLVSAFTARAEAPQTYNTTLLLVDGLTVILIVYLVQVRHSFFTRLFEFSGLVMLGRISYGLYLWHWIIFTILQDRLRFSGAQLAVVGVPLAVGISLLSYRLVEQPMLRLKSRFKAAEQETPVVVGAGGITV